jgi:hypothetical protein
MTNIKNIHKKNFNSVKYFALYGHYKNNFKKLDGLVVKINASQIYDQLQYHQNNAKLLS